MSVCEACGGSPAAPIKLKRNVGLVVMHRSVTAQAMLCVICAEQATRHFQRKTLRKGGRARGLRWRTRQRWSAMRFVRDATNA